MNANKELIEFLQTKQMGNTKVVHIFSTLMIGNMNQIVTYMTQSKTIFDSTDRFETRVACITPSGHMPWDMIA